MKIQLPKIFAAKPKKKLRATAVRKPLRIAATADYEEMAEPNMKLSRALLIVLVLHVVAVSGIIAFNALKTHQGSTSSASANASASARSSASESKTAAVTHPAATTRETPAHVETKPAHASSKTAGKEERKAEHPKATAVDNGKFYVVAKGDNPVGIAKKLKVPYDELLAVNHIEDPHKLQIGQKLIIPSKPPKAKKVEE